MLVLHDVTIIINEMSFYRIQALYSVYIMLQCVLIFIDNSFLTYNSVQFIE